MSAGGILNFRDNLSEAWNQDITSLSCHQLDGLAEARMHFRFVVRRENDYQIL
jgi:hypothetical protein